MRRIDALPSGAWWDFVRRPRVREALERYALAMRAPVSCAPLDAVLAALVEAWAPELFVAAARQQQPVDLRAVVSRTFTPRVESDPDEVLDDLVWRSRVHALLETAADDLGILRGPPGNLEIADRGRAEGLAEVLVALEEDRRRPGLPEHLADRPGGRRRRRKRPQRPAGGPWPWPWEGA